MHDYVWKLDSEVQKVFDSRRRWCSKLPFASVGFENGQTLIFKLFCTLLYNLWKNLKKSKIFSDTGFLNREWYTEENLKSCYDRRT